MNRREVCYKSAAEDPNSKAPPELTTVNWRDAPVNQPENQLIGSQYESNPVEADMVITEPRQLGVRRHRSPTRRDAPAAGGRRVRPLLPGARACPTTSRSWPTHRSCAAAVPAMPT